MNRVIRIIAITLAGTLAAGSAARAAPVASDGSVGASVDVIVVLRHQVDPGAIHAANRRLRGAAIERALRGRAAADQRGIVDLLRRRSGQGLVRRITPLWIVNAVSVSAAPSVIRELTARGDVAAVQPDVSIAAPAMVGASASTDATAEPNVSLVNAPALWDLGLRGQGVVVANMDTGVDGNHPDLAGRWRGGGNSWYDPNGEHPSTPTDVNGHGTATMGVMVGGGAGGTAIGVAPDATWIAVKIFNDRGMATSTAIHLGFQWLLDPDGDPSTDDAPDVVNNSWTMSGAGCNLDFQPDLRNLRASGVLPVFSAGNYGPTAGTVLSPANNPEAFAVGATDDADVIDPYSSRGPSACGQGVAPQLAAPGVGIRTTDLYGLYTNAYGTSVAAPHVAGALALLLSAFPDLPPDRQAAALESGVVDLGVAGPDNSYGYGRLDALAAYQWLAGAPDVQVAVAPSTVTTSAGGTASYTVSTTGVNGFDADVTLSLGGLTAAQASWTFDPATIAGGTGTAQLTVTTSPTIPPGSYPLALTAHGGGLTRTAYATLAIPAPPDFSMGVAPASRTIGQGLTTSYTVTVAARNGFAGSVNLSVTGLPASVGSVSFTPSTIAGAGSATMSVAVAATAPTGSYPFTIRGSSGELSHSAAATLVVTARGFTLASTPTSVTVARGQTARYTISTASVGGYTGAVALSVAGLPPATTVTIAPNPVGMPATASVSVKTTYRTTRGTFALTIAGTSGPYAYQVVVTLVVR